MKNTIICLLLPLLLLGCSKKTSEVTPIQPSPTLPFSVTVVETPEAKEMDSIKHQAAALLKSNDYDGLDDMATKYRKSEEGYADGGQKLALVYDGLEPSNDDSNTVREARLQEIQKWINTKPKSVTARIGLARCLISYAWKARGNYYASEVPDEDWTTFFKRLNEAVEVLNGAKNLKEQCPVYWSTSMQAALGLQASKNQFDDIFQQAIKAEPDYKYYYHNRAIFLLPRWYGKEGEWEKDLTTSADNLGGEDGDMVYAQVVWTIHHYGSSIDVFEGDKVSWERVDRGFAVILKLFPNSLAAKNERAHLAALAGDKEKARKYLIETQGLVDLSTWSEKGEYTACANWAFGQ